MLEHLVTEFKDFDIEKMMAIIAPFLGNVLMALVMLVAGLFGIKLLNKFLNTVLNNAHIDPALSSFLRSLSSIGLKVLLFTSVISTLGVQMTSFVALLGGAGVAVGLALSGTLQNFASGVLILFFKPFRVGDFIEASGQSGTVKEIQIFNTILTPIDNRTVIIPNQELSNATIVNFSQQAERRVDLKVRVAYSDDIDLVKSTLNEIIESEEEIIRKDERQVVLAELGDSAVIYYVRFWVPAKDFFVIKCAMVEKIKRTFDEKDISFPFSQRDVHLYTEK